MPELAAKRKESVSFFFPAYMDEKSIPILVKDFHNALEKTGRDFEIIIVEDHSPDDTGVVVDRLAKQYKRVRVIHHEKNMGYGGVLTKGFSSARKDLVGYTDGDAQFNVKELPAFLEAIKDADMVLGYKTSRADGMSRRILSGGFRIILRFLFGMRFKDPNCGFKMLRTKFFPVIKPTSQSGFFVAELLYNAQKNNLDVKEIPVDHFKRPFGKSAFLGFGKIFKTLKDMFRVRFFCNTLMPYKHWNPLVRFYFNGILAKVVKLADLKPNERVLDFGCQKQHLKNFLPKTVKYTGYDIEPAYSDLRDYSVQRFDKIFALNVLEHLDEKELKQTLRLFKRTGAKKLIVSLPAEHAVGKFLAFIHGYSHSHEEEHKNNWKNVERILSEELVPEKKTGFFTMQKMSTWQLN